LASIVDEELELAETAVLSGGLVGKTLANKLAGYSVGSNHIYKLRDRGHIESWHIGGSVYFSAIDCVMWRRKKDKLRAYADSERLGIKGSAH